MRKRKGSITIRHFKRNEPQAPRYSQNFLRSEKSSYLHCPKTGANEVAFPGRNLFSQRLPQYMKTSLRCCRGYVTWVRCGAKKCNNHVTHVTASFTPLPLEVIIIVNEFSLYVHPIAAHERLAEHLLVIVVIADLIHLALFVARHR